MSLGFWDGVGAGMLVIMLLDFLGLLIARKRLRIWQRSLEETNKLADDLREIDSSIVDYAAFVMALRKKGATKGPEMLS